MTKVTAFINNRVNGSKPLVFDSFPTPANYIYHIISKSGRLYYSNGTVWNPIISGSAYSELSSIPTLPNEAYPSGYVIKNTTNGNFYIVNSAGDGVVQLSFSKSYIQIPNTAFVDKKVPTLTEAQTWVNLNLTADQKKYSTLYMIEDTLNYSGFGIVTTYVIGNLHLGSSNMVLSSVTINGVTTSINQNIESPSHLLSMSLLSSTGISAASTAIVNAFLAQGISAIVEIYANSQFSASIMISTKGPATHTVYFTYTKDGGATFTDTGSATSPARALTLGTDSASPDHTWECVDGIVKNLYHRKYNGSIYYIKKQIPTSVSCYAQVGNPDRPFRSTTEALLYGGITSFPSGSEIVFLESGSSTTGHLNVVVGNNIRVNCNNFAVSVLAKFESSNRTISINDISGGSIFHKSTSTNGSLIVKGSKFGSSNFLFSSQLDSTGVQSKVDIIGHSVNFSVYAYGDVSYNVDCLNVSGSGGVFAYDYSLFTLRSNLLSCPFYLRGYSSLSCNVINATGSFITVDENSSLNSVFNLLTSIITLKTSANVFINTNFITSEIIVAKTSVTAEKPKYNINAEYVELSTVNKLLVDLTTNNIQDFIVNYRFNTANEVNMCKATPATSGAKNFEINFTFNEVKFTSTSILSWESPINGVKISYKGIRCVYEGTSDVNIVYFKNTNISGAINNVSFDCDFYAPNLGAYSRFRIFTQLGDFFKFNGKIWVPNATSLFVTEVYSDSVYLQLSGIMKCSTTLINEISEDQFPMVVLKDLLYIFTVITGTNEIVENAGLDAFVVVQNASTNKTAGSSTVGYVGGTVIRNPNYLITQFI